jgi:hypothetical protein
VRYAAQTAQIAIGSPIWLYLRIKPKVDLLKMPKVVSKFQITPKNKAWADEKAQHTCCM